jgi:hypothetical protein
MLPQVLAIMSANHGLITRKQAIAAGLTEKRIDRLVRTRDWIAVRRGVYAEASFVEAQTTLRDQRLLADRAACLRISMAFVRSHDTAAYELDLDILAPRRPLTHVTRPVVVGSHLRHGVKHHLAPYADDQVVEMNGFRCLDPARTSLDIAREHGGRAGMVAVDSARRLGATLDALWRAESGMWSWPEVTVVRESIELSDPDSDSVIETLGRELVTELGFGRPQTQFGLTADGRTAWCDLRLGRHIFECDGRVKYQRVDEGGFAVTSADDVLWREKQRQNWVCGFRLGMSRIVNADFWGRRRQEALTRFRREYLESCALFGESIDDLAQYRPRGPRPRPHRRVEDGAA